MNKEKAYCLASIYYPEHGTVRCGKRFRRMKEMGFRSVRMMEFARVLLEPTPGKFDFSLFDGAIEPCGANA